MKFEDKPEAKMGDYSQRKWAKVMAARGHLVLPVYELLDRDPSTKAPIAFLNDGLIVAPDLLLCGTTNMWHDVKAKSCPTWRRTHKRWEHGIDYSSAEEYQLVVDKSGMPTWIIVHELKSPIDADNESALVPSGIWMGIPIDKAFEVGEHRKDWPGGREDKHRRGRRGMGGLLWARKEMSVIHIKEVEPPIAIVELPLWMTKQEPPHA